MVQCKDRVSSLSYSFCLLYDREWRTLQTRWPWFSMVRRKDPSEWGSKLTDAPWGGGVDSTAAPAAAAGSLRGASPKDPLVGEDWLTCNFYPVALVAMCFSQGWVVTFSSPLRQTPAQLTLAHEPFVTQLPSATGCVALWWFDSALCNDIISIAIPDPTQVRLLAWLPFGHWWINKFKSTALPKIVAKLCRRSEENFSLSKLFFLLVSPTTMKK